MNSREGNDRVWESFKSGDRRAFALIYREHVMLLLNYGSKIISDHLLVEDCIQDLFIELWASRERLASTDSIKFYLFKALRYKIYRRINVNGTALMESIEDHIAVLKDYSDEENYFQEETQLQMARLRDRLDKLPARQREAINLRYFHYFENEEIAQIMGVNYHSACKFIYAGLKNLKNNLTTSAFSISLISLFFQLVLK